MRAFLGVHEVRAPPPSSRARMEFAQLRILHACSQKPTRTQTLTPNLDWVRVYCRHFGEMCKTSTAGSGQRSVYFWSRLVVMVYKLVQGLTT